MSIVQPSKIKGTVPAPPSKSAMQRYVALSLLTEGQTVLHSISNCDDCNFSLDAAQALGATISKNGQSVSISNKRTSRHPTGVDVSCGESGTSVRILASVAAALGGPFTLTGSGSLMTRPMDMIEEALKKLGVTVHSNKGKLPLTITGPLKGGAITIDGSVTSQFLSGLLISLPTVDGDSTITVDNLKSRPYVDMTVECVEEFGGIIHRDQDVFYIKGNQRYIPKECVVEGDWSGASFLLVAGAIGGEVVVTGLRNNSKQADRAIVNAIRDFGGDLHVARDSISVRKHKLKAFVFDANDCPDLMPPLCALASACQGTSIIKGAKRLFHKESNRAAALQSEFAKLGITISIDDDDLVVTGGKIRGGVTVSSHGDHRIAMACAVAATQADTPVTIDGSESVNKSFPSFFELLSTIGTPV